MSATLEYFEKASCDYDVRSESSWWQWVRLKELRAVLHALPERSYDRILELGCGAGFYTSHLIEFSRHRRITCVDFSPSMLGKLQIAGAEKICQPMEELRLDRKFDLIFCGGALEFVSDPAAVVANAEKMLSEHGCIVLLLPRKGFLPLFYQLYHWWHGVTITRFGAADILEKICGEKLMTTNVIPAFPITICLRLERRTR